LPVVPVAPVAPLAPGTWPERCLPPSPPCRQPIPPRRRGDSW